MSTTKQLNENSKYEIVNLKSIETKYGTTYIMMDNNLNEYWSNKKINDFIKKHRIPLNNDDKVLFKIKTGDYKTFQKDGNEIRFLNLICSK